ncbi:MAG: Na+/H+ antiporter subunit E [Pseudomonadota bacterium]
MKRLFPHPWLSLTLILLWFMLVNELKLGSLVMAILLATAIPLITSSWWPDRPRVRRPFGLAAYAVLVLWDVIVANFQVARIVLFMPRDRIRSNWVTIPLDLTSPEAITLLAGTITMTPGTLTADLSADGRALLVHALHAPDPEAVRDDIKARYEARLIRIFG